MMYQNFMMRILISILAGLVSSNIKATTPASDSTVSMIFTGDISFDGPVKYFSEIEKSCGYKSPFDKIKRFLDDADLRIGNLESPLLEEAYGLKPALEGKLIYHYGSVKAVEGLKYAGFDVMQLANNHINDFVDKGIKSTTKTLENAGIGYVGLRNDSIKNLSQTPLIKTVNGVRIGFLAYCQNKEGCDLYQCNTGECKNSSGVFNGGAAVLDKRVARFDIDALRKKVDWVVVLLHWGRELSLMPAIGMRDIAKLLKIYGANLIIGGHPHVIQGHECRGSNGLAVYSLGNFLFPRKGIKNLSNFLGGDKPTRKNVEMYIKSMKEKFSPTQFSYIFRITVNKEHIVEAEYLPLEIKNDPRTNCLQPTPLSSDWIEFCGSDDLYCYDFANLCASTHGLQEQQMSSKINKQFCISEKKVQLYKRSSK